MSIFIVETNGFLHWYRYTGNSEYDPSGVVDGRNTRNDLPPI